MCEVHGSDCVFPRAGPPAPASGNTGQPPRAAIRAARASRTATLKNTVNGVVGQPPGSSTSPRLEGRARAGTRASTGDKISERIAPKHTTQRRSPMRTTSDRQEKEIPFANVGATPGSLPDPQDPKSNPAGSHEDDEAHVIGPVHSPDAQLIQSYLMRDAAAGRGPGPGPIRGVTGAAASAAPGQRPVMFSAVRRHPLGRSAGLSAAGTRLEVVEKLLEPYADDLVNL